MNNNIKASTLAPNIYSTLQGVEAPLRISALLVQVKTFENFNSLLSTELVL